MASLYDTPSPPSVARMTYATMPTFTPAQNAAVEERIRKAFERLSFHCTPADPFEPVTVNIYPTPDSNRETSPETATESKVKKSTTWCTQDVGYFLPEQTLEEHVVLENGIIFYQDVWAFTNYLRVLAESTEEETICANLHFCLRDKALEWYTTELTPTQRAELRDQSLEAGWFNALANRFTPSKEIAEDQLSHRGYGWSDVRAGYSVVVWAHNLLRHAQTIDSGMAFGSGWEDDCTIEQLQTIWESLCEDFAKDITYPGDKTAVAGFMLELDEAYKRWRWVILTGPKNYEPRVRRPAESGVDGVNGVGENGYANGEVAE